MKETQVRFTGTGLDFFLFMLVRVLLVIVTLGLYLFFLNAAKRRWTYERTFFGEHNMVYRTSFLDWLVGTLINTLLMAFSFGLAAPWVMVRAKRYAMEHSYLSDGRRFAFTGSGVDVILLLLVTMVALPLSLGFAFPWIAAMWKNWEWRNTRLSAVPTNDLGQNGLKFHFMEFRGTGGQLAGTFILNFILTMLTLGCYGPWAAVGVMVWEAENIHLRDAKAAA